MRKNQNVFMALFALPLLTAGLFTACKKETSHWPEQHSPKYYLMKSEKLVLPSTVELPAHAKGYTRIATYYASGVQKYKAQARAGSNPFVYDWVFVAPQAVLYNHSNHQTGTHGAGPFWQIEADSIFAQAMNPARSSPSPDGSIDWLLLIPKVGKPATGRFEQTQFIQRIATTGGRPPAIAPVSADETASIPYTAVYRFSKKIL